MNLEVYDIESYNGLFLLIAYNIQDKSWVIFEISQYRNDLYSLVKYLNSRKGKYQVSFNGVGYDAQVLQYIIDTYELWVDLGNIEIVRLIKKFSNKVIDNSKYGLFAPYREEELNSLEVDLFKIHHFDNENRRTSLKWLQFSMDFHTVEESPIEFERENFTPEEILECIEYCKNDIQSTLQFYYYTIGEVEHEEYKGRNKIQDRLDLIAELGFPKKAMNYSDVKIGDEINKKVYKELTKSTDSKLYDLKKNRKPRRGFTFGDCIPDYVKFVTPEFQHFHKVISEVRVDLNEPKGSKPKTYPFTYNKTTYTIAKGGLHSTDRNRITIPLRNEVLRDADIGSQYPHALIKRGLFPSHLGKQWLVGYTGTRNRRLGFKSKLKLYEKSTDAYRKMKGLSETFKLALNGGGFGKTNERSNWQYDPFVHFSCTIGNQFEILMLIEMLETNGIHVISANTDGIVCLFDKDKSDLYYSICSAWEEIVGNSEQGKLEYTDYSKLIQSTVNDYIAIPTDGSKIKKKGDFATYFELNKDKSCAIIPMAIEKYFINDIPVEKTIMEYDRIFDFCSGVKSSRNYHYETVDKAGKRELYHRMIRYYISTTGEKLLKIKNEDSEAPGNDVTNCEAGGWKCTVANIVDVNIPISSYNIDYSYYIIKAEEMIQAIEGGRKKKGKIIIRDPNQTSLF